jgi:malonyl-CoA O-methyltransferase
MERNNCFLDTHSQADILGIRFRKSIETYNEAATVQRKIAGRLGELIALNGIREFHRILEIGCGTGFLTREVNHRFRVDEFFLNDLVASSMHTAMLCANRNNCSLLPGNAEEIPFPGRLDAVFSASAIQWFKNIEGFFCKVSGALKENGILALGTFGEENFREIKQLTGIGLRYPSLRQLQTLAANDFNIIVQEEWQEEICFPDAIEVLRHIQKTGVNGITRFKMTKGMLKNFREAYHERYCCGNGNVKLTYHPVILLCSRKKIV